MADLKPSLIGFDPTLPAHQAGSALLSHTSPIENLH